MGCGTCNAGVSIVSSPYEQDVEIEETRPFRECLSAAHYGLDAAQRHQQLERRRFGFACDDAIQKPGLFEKIDRLRLVNRRDASDLHTSRWERGDRGANSLAIPHWNQGIDK